MCEVRFGNFKFRSSIEKGTVMERIKKVKNKRGERVIPGFGMNLGITVTMLSLLVLIPLASVFIRCTSLSFSDFIKAITSETALSAYYVTIKCSLIAALINGVFGILLAWVLVRYDFPGKRLMDGMIELPFAMPTAVAGITLTNLYSDKGIVGSWLANLGISVAYTRIGITIAMVFIGIPFVVRAIQPVLSKMDFQYEEAARMLGAGKIRTFFKVVLPEILPAALTGFGLAFARGIGEYGSVEFISKGDQDTTVVSMLIMKELNAGSSDYAGATSIALVMLIFSFILLFVINMVQVHYAKYTAD